MRQETNRDVINNSVKNLIEQYYKIDYDINHKIVDSLDSLDRVDLVMELEKEFDVFVEGEGIEKLVTFEDLVNLFDKLINNKDVCQSN